MNAGTILYIPVAQAEGGATVTVKGQLYGPTLKLDGTDITTGTAVTIATDSTRYVPLSVEGTGSLYLTGIAIDYAAGSPAATSHTVTVGPNGQYRTIQAALDANDSSETDRLVLKITPGDYREKITVTKPGVTFANADVTAKRAVTIRASYYSSNTFDADGKFVPQDEFDLGTNKCDHRDHWRGCHRFLRLRHHLPERLQRGGSHGGGRADAGRGAEHPGRQGVPEEQPHHRPSGHSVRAGRRQPRVRGRRLHRRHG